ncbi:hypothetical protein GGR56DRAFT_657308 [Xylariaceae sp. FL0804]|nr:hypothetical protein GGR56DRAFT_657308 [Xylariaceae sp. FL0804]
MDSMDLDLEMDMDVDLVPDEPIVAEPDLPDDPGNRSPGEVDDDADALAPSKIYIRGLDVLNPRDVKAYVMEHCSGETFERIEWIDDSSANLLFASEAVASQALLALSADPISDVARLPLRQLLPAKPFSQRTEVSLQVRPALASDRKQVGAASRSRFYLLNPEYDPEERRRRNEARRYRDRDMDTPARRRGRLAREREANEEFDASMYDDDAKLPGASQREGTRNGRRRSYTPESDGDQYRRDSYREVNRGKELFPNGSSRRRAASRGRSASPDRDRDGDGHMDGFSSESSAPRNRNRDRAHVIKSHMSRRTRATELFPDRELFPEKSPAESGRLGDGVEDAATLLAKGITLPLVDGSDDAPPVRSRRLEDRVTAPANGGRLVDRISKPEATPLDSAFNIRGTANQRGPNQGFAIKGGAGKSVRELFPDKFGSNAGKELFGDGGGGRTKRRQKAGDLFD